MDPDNIPNQSKVARVCSRITSFSCLQGEEPWISFLTRISQNYKRNTRAENPHKKQEMERK